jgi:hypothetical protein
VPHWSHLPEEHAIYPVSNGKRSLLPAVPPPFFFLSLIGVDLPRPRYANRERNPQRGKCEVGAWPSYSEANRTPTRGRSFDCSLGVDPDNDGTGTHDNPGFPDDTCGHVAYRPRPVT